MTTRIILLDDSGSMRGENFQKGKIALPGFLIEEGEYVIWKFARDIECITRAKRSIIQKEIDEIFSEWKCRGDGTALYDSIYTALNIELVRGVEGEIKIIILTDGMDNASRKSLSDVMNFINEVKVKRQLSISFSLYYLREDSPKAVTRGISRGIGSSEKQLRSVAATLGASFELL